MALFIKEFKGKYQERTAYKNLVRVFNEHYRFEEKNIVIKQGKELSGSTLQSPDDIDATYRKKNGEGAKGYVANFTETCNSENDLQLITTTSVEPNTTDDQKLMAVDLENLQERTNIGEIKQGKPGRYSAGFDSSTCDICPFKDKCFAKKLKKKDLSIIRFTDDSVRVALQRQQFKASKDKLNIRASVESTVRSVIHPFGGQLCKLPVRGKERVKTMVILEAAMVNIRRITGYLSLKSGNEGLIPVIG